MATIGWLKLLFSADTSGLAKGAKQAAGIITALGAQSKIAAAGIADIGLVAGRITSRAFGTMGAGARVATGGIGLIGRGIAGTVGGIKNFTFWVAESVAKVIKFGAVAGLAAAGGLALLGKAGMERFEENRKLAMKLGESTEAVSKLGYAARMSGVDSEALSGNLTKMQVRLGQVALTGEGKAAKALQNFGLSADQLARGGAVEAFHTIAGMLDQIPNPAEKAAIAVDLFGKSGVEMLGFLGKGTDEIKALEQEASDLGIAMSDIDSEKVHDAHEAVKKLWEAFGALGNRIIVELSPFISELAEGLTQMAKNGVGGADLVSQGIGWMIEGFGTLADIVQASGAAWQAFKSAALMAVSKVLEGIGWLADKINQFAEFLGQ